MSRKDTFHFLIFVFCGALGITILLKLLIPPAPGWLLYIFFLMCVAVCIDQKTLKDIMKRDDSNE